MRFAMIAMLVACASPDKTPAQPSNHIETTGSATTTPAPDDRAKLEKAQREADEARKEAREATERLDRLAKDLDELDRKVTVAIDAVVAAQDDADRARAKVKLEKLRKEKAAMDQRIQDAKAAATKAAYLRGRKISPECVANPLATGCF